MRKPQSLGRPVGVQRFGVFTYRKEQAWGTGKALAAMEGSLIPAPGRSASLSKAPSPAGLGLKQRQRDQKNLSVVPFGLVVFGFTIECFSVSLFRFLNHKK